MCRAQSNRYLELTFPRSCDGRELYNHAPPLHALAPVEIGALRVLPGPLRGVAAPVLAELPLPEVFVSPSILYFLGALRIYSSLTNLH